jgi:hypothetical protein
VSKALTFLGIGRGTAPPAKGLAGLGVGVGGGNTAAAFRGIGLGGFSPQRPKPPVLETKVASRAVCNASPAKPKAGRLADRISVAHARAMPADGDTKCDAIIFTVGTARYSSQLSQSPQVGSWVSVPMPSPMAGVDRNELSKAVMEATKRDLPKLFRHK